jgi:AGZA family xanthine/uracil permease-like MFS transporter
MGLLIIAALEVRKIKGAVLIGIGATAAAAFALGLAHFGAGNYDLAAMTGTAFKLDIPAALNLGGKHGLGVLEIIFVFLFIDLFDNVGTLVAVTKRAGLQATDGSIPRLNRILVADSVATIAGSLAGTSTVVSYIESAAGVSAGGRTGLTAVVTGLLFLAALALAPLVQGLPEFATAPALIMIGAMMITPLAEVQWKDPTIALPAFLTFAVIPLTYSIANGLAFGVTSFAVLKLISGKLGKRDWMLGLLAAAFVARFIYLAAG